MAELRPPLTLPVDMMPHHILKTQSMALADTPPGDTKKTLCRISFLVTSRISLVTFTSLPTVGGTRRKSRILEEKDSCSDVRDHSLCVTYRSELNKLTQQEFVLLIGSKTDPSVWEEL